MKLRHDLRYSAPPDAVLTMLLDPAFWDKVAEATGALSSTTMVEGTDFGTRVVTEQEERVAGVPSFARKFVGDSTVAIKRQTWNGLQSSFEVETPGKPTGISGSASLAPDADGSLLSYDLDVRASVPLVGGKLEKLVADLTTEGFEKEHAVGVAWLAGGAR